MLGLLTSITLAALCCALVARLERQRLALADVRERFAEAGAEWEAALRREAELHALLTASVRRESELDALLTETREHWQAALQREAELRTLIAKRPTVQRHVGEA